MKLETLSIEEGIQVQVEQLKEWETKLIPEVYEALKDFSISKNNEAKTGNDICRGNDLTIFVLNYKVEQFGLNEMKELILHQLVELSNEYKEEVFKYHYSVFLSTHIIKVDSEKLYESDEFKIKEGDILESFLAKNIPENLMFVSESNDFYFIEKPYTIIKDGKSSEYSVSQNYYADCTIKFREEDTEDEYQEEHYSFTFLSKNKEEAEVEAKHKAYTEFWNELGKDWETECIINEIYVTSEK